MKYNYAHAGVLFILLGLLLLSSCTVSPPSNYNGDQAMQYAQTLISFGHRIPGSSAIDQSASYIQTELEQFGWQVSFQEFTHDGILLRNILAKKTDVNPDTIIGTHYDTRAISDQESDSTLQATPVPGANDGTSGTAVLMEMAQSLKDDDINLWLVFFDGEDQGHINDWDWSVGAQYFADQLETYPQQVVIIDMIGDADLNIYKEKNSDPNLTRQIWDTAQSLGFRSSFVNREKYAMIDDHLPFANLGIPSCLLIDFDYPYWHTQADTLDKLSEVSLEIVGQVLLEWLYNR